MKRILFRSNTALAWASVAALGAALAAASPAAADGPGDTSVPHAAVEGFRNPVAGRLDLAVLATDDGSGLAQAAAVLDGVTVASVALCPNPPDCPKVLSGIPLPVDSTKVPDGIHHLLVTVTDAANNTLNAIDSDIEVINKKPEQSPTATLTIGSGDTTDLGGAQGGSGSGGVAGAGANSGCRSPKLSMFLAQKPLRITKGVAVLAKGRRYRFTGRLTCLVKGKRVSAPANTKIDVHNVVKGKTIRKGGATVRTKGKITLILAYQSSRAIEFSYRSDDGKLSKVRIRVLVARVKKKG
jgi:hypothetical protein